MASKPTLKRPSALITTSTQACSAAGSSGGTLPAGTTVVLRSRNSQPKENGTGNAPPPTFVDCASAGNGKMGSALTGGGENGKGLLTVVCSCSSKVWICPNPRGYQEGVVPHLKVPCRTFESRQTTRFVPPLNGPPLTKRAANFVARGSRLSTAVQPT